MLNSAKLATSVDVIGLFGSASLRRDRGDELPRVGTSTIFVYSGVHSCTVQAQSERANMFLKGGPGGDRAAVTWLQCGCSPAPKSQAIYVGASTNPIEKHTADVQDLDDVRTTLEAFVGAVDTGLLVAKGRNERAVVNAVRLFGAALAYLLGRSQPGRAEPEAPIEIPMPMTEFITFLKARQEAGQALVLPPLGPDISPEVERKVAAMVLTAYQAQRERNIWLSRQSSSRKGQGAHTTASPEIKARIRQMHAEGRSYREMARQLEADGVPTLRGGGRWPPTTIGKLVKLVQHEARLSPRPSSPGLPLRSG